MMIQFCHGDTKYNKNLSGPLRCLHKSVPRPLYIDTWLPVGLGERGWGRGASQLCTKHKKEGGGSMAM